MDEMELNEKIEEDAVLREAEHLEAEISRERKEKRRTFLGGVLLGTGLSFLVVMVVWALMAHERLILSDHTTTQQASAEATADGHVIAKIDEIMALMMTSYYEEIDAERLITGIYRGLLASVDDKYTVYYTPEEYETMMISASATYSGIGTVLAQDNDTMQVTVLRVYEGTPAEEAGIRAGDEIVRAGTITATSMPLSDLVTTIRGKEGEQIQIVIYRPSTDETFTRTLTRRKIDVPTVYEDMADGEAHIGYIQITEFGDHTAIEFHEAYEALVAEGMTALILDLRDNPGGMVTSVVAIADEILPEGLIVYTEDRNGKRVEYTSEKSCIDLPICVLINGNSASSSEILAGALKCHDYATLIGTTTYGKGIVQSIKKLSDGSAVKITTSRYFTPDGENIQGVGITPDIELEYDYIGDANADYEYRYDSQVERAIEVLCKE